MIQFDVRPGRGVGRLIFGASQRDVTTLLGAPDRLEEDDDGTGSVAWHYDSLGLSLHFDGDSALRLDLIDVSRLEVRVLGLRPIGLEVEEARKLFGERGGFVLDGEFPDTRGAVYDLPGSWVSLWFEDGFCDSVQLIVPIDDDGEYVWPAA